MLKVLIPGLGSSNSIVSRTHLAVVTVDEESSCLGLELIGKCLMMPCEIVSATVLISVKTSSNAADVNVPPLVKSGLYLPLCEGQVLMKQSQTCRPWPSEDLSGLGASYLVRVHCPFAVLRLEILLVSSFCELYEVNS